MGKHRSDFFTNSSRLFIYECICRTFSEKRTTLQKEQFEFEIQKRYDSVKDKARIDDFMSEFDLIRSTQLTAEMDTILQNLEEVQLANGTEALIREAYSKLESGNYVEAANILKRKSIDLGEMQKENRIYNLHKDSDDWFEEVKRRKEHPEIYAGIPTGFREFDERTGGLFPAELTVVFGLSGKGKSTLMKAMACNIRKTGRNVLHCGNEENEFQMRSKYMSADSGTLYTPFKRGSYADDDFNALKKYSDHERNAQGAIYIYEFPQQTDATWIERAYHQLEMQGIHIDVIVVDYLDLMKPCEKAYSENDEGGKVTSDLKQIAINCNCPVVTATQAGIQSEKQEKKDNPFLNQSDVFGTKRKVHSANTLIGIVNQTATAQAEELSVEKRRLHHLVLCVPKNRDGAIFTFRQVVDTHTGQFMEDDRKSPDEWYFQEMAKQALRMCDDTQPGKMIQHIDIESSMEARNQNVNSGMDEVRASLERQNGGASTPAQEETVKEDDFFSESAIQKQTENENKEETPQDSVNPDEFLSEAPSNDGDSAQEGHEDEIEDVTDAPTEESNPVESNAETADMEIHHAQTIEEYNRKIEERENEASLPFDNPNVEKPANEESDGEKTIATSEDISHKFTADSIFRRMKGNNRKNG
jgi:replicative DNA helicase